MPRTSFPSRLEDEFEAYISDEASIAASELCGPNSFEYEEVWESKQESDEFRASWLPGFLAQQGFGMVDAPGGLSWPVYGPRKVFHLGTMDPQIKGRTHNACSLEGNGLSISTHPEAWREIARLGGEDKWELCREGAKFVDLRSLGQEHLDAVIQWAQQQGLVEMVPVAQVSYDGEYPGEGFRTVAFFDMTCPEQQRMAKDELEAIEPEEHPRMETVDMPRATLAMNERVGFKVPMGHVGDIALTLYAEDVLHESLGLDGVWWEDDLSPADLSAPRGVIHLRALSSWQIEKVQERSLERRCAALTPA